MAGDDEQGDGLPSGLRNRTNLLIPLAEYLPCTIRFAISSPANGQVIRTPAGTAAIEIEYSTQAVAV